MSPRPSMEKSRRSPKKLVAVEVAFVAVAFARVALSAAAVEFDILGKRSLMGASRPLATVTMTESPEESNF